MKQKLWSQRYLWIALFAALIASILVQWPRIEDPYSIEDDFRNQYWMNLFDDHELFQAVDPFVNEWILRLPIGPYTLITFTGSPGYSLLFQLANEIIPFLLFGKLLIFPITLVSVYYIFRIGKSLSDERTALGLSIVFIAIALVSTTTVSTTAGLQRTFSFPLLLGLIYYLMIGRDHAALLVVFFAGILYPPVFILCAATYGLSLIEASSSSSKPARFNLPLRFNIRRGIELMLVSIVVLIAWSPMLISRSRSSQDIFVVGYEESLEKEFSRVFWPATDDRSVLKDAFYKSPNRGALFVLFPFVGRAGLSLQGTSPIHIFVLFVMFVLIWLLTRFRAAPIPRVLKLFIAAVWLCYVLSWLVILLTSSFLLYFPSRYTEAGLVLFLLIVVILNLSSAVDQAAEHLQNPKIVYAAGLPVLLVAIGVALSMSSVEGIEGRMDPSDFRMLIIILGIILILLIAISGVRRWGKSKLPMPENNNTNHLLKPFLGVGLLIVLAIYVKNFQAEFIIPSQDERDLYSYLETLPSDAILAGKTPARENSIYFFAKMQMLVACEDPTMDPLFGSLEAYYAGESQIESIVTFCNACGVDYYLVDQQSYSEEALAEERLEYAESYLEDLMDSIDASSDFALNSVPENAKLFQAGDFSVVPCDERLLEKPPS